MLTIRIWYSDKPRMAKRMLCILKCCNIGQYCQNVQKIVGYEPLYLDIKWFISFQVAQIICSAEKFSSVKLCGRWVSETANYQHMVQINILTINIWYCKFHRVPANFHRPFPTHSILFIPMKLGRDIAGYKGHLVLEYDLK